MKNRILSLVLAIVMVVLAVPAFVLPMTAANTTGFKTSFGYQQESWPLHSDEEFLGYATPWEVGRFKVGQGAISYATFFGYDAQFDILNLNGGDQWDNCGIYCNNSRYILTGKGVATDIAADAVDNRNALVLTYTSPYEGKVNLGFDNITPVNAETVTCLDMYVAIFLNGKMIWPVAGGDMGTAADWAHLLSDAEPTNTTGKTALDQFNEINPDALKNLEVTRGDKIQFALSRGGSNYGYAEPTVTFADGYLVVPTKIAEQFGYASNEWPIIGNGSGNRTFKQTSERWTIGDIAVAGGTFNAYDHYFRKSTDSWACRTGEDYPGNSGKNPSNGAIMLTSSFADLRGGILFGDAKDYIPGFAYEAIATGTAVPSFEDLKLITTDKGGDYAVATTGTVKISVYKNGTLVETVTATATADGVTATMPEIAVTRGDVIVLAASAGTGTVGMCGAPTVTYKTVDSFMTEVTDETYAIKMENGTALFGDSFGVTFYTYATKEVYNNYTEAGLYVWKGVAAADRTVDNATVVPATLNDSYAFVANYSNFVAKEMADDIAVQSYVKVIDGNDVKTITSDVVENKSVADYIAEQYTETKDGDLKKVLVAMLNYGAYAQVYFNYNTENLANAVLAADEQAMDKEILYYASFDGVKGSTNNICNSEIEAFALDLNNTINLKVYINIDEHEKFDEKGELRKMQLQIAESKDELGASGQKVDINTNAGTYTEVVLVENISLTEMSKTFYFRVTCRYGPTLYYGYNFSYSIESYAARMVDSTEPGLADLVRAMMEFGKAINAYNA